MKMKVLDQKHLLKRAASGLIPPSVRDRYKQPYRAPDGASFFGKRASYVGDLLSALPCQLEEGAGRTGFGLAILVGSDVDLRAVAGREDDSLVVPGHRPRERRRPAGTDRGLDVTAHPDVTANPDGDVLLRVDHVRKYFPIRKGILLQREVARVHAVDDVSFEVHPGEIVALLVTGSPEGMALSLKKGSVAALELRGRSPRTHAKLRWLLAPRHLRRIGRSVRKRLLPAV